MRKILQFILAAILLLAFSSCGNGPSSGVSSSWQSQYDLGQRYLSDGNYEEAIIAFTAAVEIDKKNADAYLGLADAYLGSDDTEKARGILNEALSAVDDTKAIEEKLAEIAAAEADGSSDGDTESGQMEDTEGTGQRIDTTGDADLIVSGNVLKVSLTDPELKEQYLIQRESTPENDLEYNWGVTFTDGTQSLEISTSTYKFTGEYSEKEHMATLFEMQTDLWLLDDSGGGNSIMYEGIDFSISGNTLTWSFSIPDEYAFNYGNVSITGNRIFKIAD